MIKIGIDPSINSTGICVQTKKGPEYYILCSKMTKKMSSFKHKKIHIIKYNKIDIKNMDYSNKEVNKSQNIYNIIIEIEKILKKYKGAEVYMEGISYGSSGSVADLAGLNFAIRMVMVKNNIDFHIVSPTSLKTFATNNAGANKEEMIWAWKLLDSDITKVTEIKIDDLADAYFLSRYVL